MSATHHRHRSSHAGGSPYGKRFLAGTTIACSAGGGGATKTFNPVAGATGAAALPAGDVVSSLDIVEPTPGTSVALSDIQVAGLTITSYATFTNAGTVIS